MTAALAPSLHAPAHPAGVEKHHIATREQWLGLRRSDVTASVVGCLLGVHEYITPLELWALKSAKTEEDPEQTAAMERGELLEPVAVQLIRRRNPTWMVQHPVRAYYRDPVARLGCTPDCFVQDPARDGFGAVQLKSVEATVFRRKWCDPATREVAPPLWIACQAILESHLTGASWCAVGALVVGFGLDLHMVEVPIHAGVIRRIRNEVAHFWAMVESGTAPDADHGRDGMLLERLFDPIDGEEADLSANNALPALLDERERLSKERKGAEARLSEIKTELLVALGNHARGRVADGRVITAKRVRRKAYQVEASEYVDLRVMRASNGASL